MTDLTSLIERVEAATVGSRELDILVGAAVDLRVDGCPQSFRSSFELCGMEQMLRMVESPQNILREALPRYTTSIDAALTLLPDGKCWRLAHGHLVGCTSAVAEVMERGFGTKLSLAEAATPALALLAAILRARQTEPRHDKS